MFGVFDRDEIDCDRPGQGIAHGGGEGCAGAEDEGIAAYFGVKNDALPTKCAPRQERKRSCNDGLSQQKRREYDEKFKYGAIGCRKCKRSRGRADAHQGMAGEREASAGGAAWGGSLRRLRDGDAEQLRGIGKRTGHNARAEFGERSVCFKAGRRRKAPGLSGRCAGMRCV